jgi:hypothetical protein
MISFYTFKTMNAQFSKENFHNKLLNQCTVKHFPILNPITKGFILDLNIKVVSYYLSSIYVSNKNII